MDVDYPRLPSQTLLTQGDTENFEPFELATSKSMIKSKSRDTVNGRRKRKTKHRHGDGINFCPPYIDEDGNEVITFAFAPVAG